MTDMERGLEKLLLETVEEASVRIIADDPRVRRLTAWAMGESVQLDPEEEPDFYDLMTHVDRIYGTYDYSLVDRAMVICEREIEQEHGQT
jgi:hypothetical protein